jgi:putative sigma-54 modulation protein
MQVEFTGRNFTVSPAIKEHTKEHFAKLDTLMKSAFKAHVILSIGKHHKHAAEIVVHWKEHELTSLADSNDMYASVSQAINRLYRQAQKLKGKTIALKHPTVPTKVAVAKIETDALREKNAPRIIRSRRYSIKPMTADQAMFEVNTSPEHFLVFRNSESDRIGVIYKRKDGNFGLIEP